MKFNVYKLINFMYLLFFFAFLSISYFNTSSGIFFEIAFYVISFVYILFSYKKIHINMFVIWNVFFLIISLLATVNSLDPTLSGIDLRNIIRLAVTGNSLVFYIDSNKKLTNTLKIIMFAGLALLIYLLIVTPLSQLTSGRLGGYEYGLNANEVGLSLTISAIISTHFWMIEKKYNYILMVLLLGMAVFLTGSRKSIFILLAGVIGVFYLNSDNLSKKIKTTVITILVVFVAFLLIYNVPFLYEITGKRIETLLDLIFGMGSGDVSTRIRSDMINQGITLFLDKPLAGYGLRAYEVLSVYGTYAHNNFIELLVGVGLIGTLHYYFMYMYLFYYFIKFRIDKSTIPLFVILSLLFISEIFLVTYNVLDYQIIIFLSFSSIRILKKNIV